MILSKQEQEWMSPFEWGDFFDKIVKRINKILKNYGNKRIIKNRA